ncbi:hypothetical protein BCR44DRAFT_1514856 [Catenaria anguillulae PL171]|uniref:Chromatin elongation factor SPT5 n=1 Tax=Catenaria anguillulae PL171 TaxID=765915 RepID=A0A1Y2HH89_9FUNG|nr:hypothetical protein BCR44DRAFT_1514856 [Catenaria anguillulae PL171]
MSANNDDYDNGDDARFDDEGAIGSGSGNGAYDDDDEDDIGRYQTEDLEGEGEDDDDDDEEDEEDEEDRGGRKRRKRKKASGPNMFLDMEAEVEDADEDEEDYAEEEEGFIDREEEEVPDTEVYMRDRRAHRELEQELQRTSNHDLHDLAAQYDVKYQARERRNRRFMGGSASSAPQSALLPSSVSDPKMWMIRCREGKERDIVHLLMRKSLDAARRAASGTGDKPMMLHSALYRDDLKGFFYVEADGVPGVYMSKMTLVPVKEMPDVLYVKPEDKSEDLLAKEWVRIKRGKYAGDLAKVVETNFDGTEATVQLLPRLNLDDFDDRRKMARGSGVADDEGGDGAAGSGGTAAKRKRGGKAVGGASAAATRPPQRLFNPREFPSHISRKITRGANGTLKLGGETFRDGYLEKAVRVTALDLNGAPPTLEEIEKFAGGSHGVIDAKTLKSLKHAAETREAEGTVFTAGDRVVVTQGELANVPAIIKSIENKIALIVPVERNMFGQTSVPITQLRKHFVPGNAVRVISGKYQGKLGTVVAVDNSAVTIVDVVEHVELQVFARDLADAKDQAVSAKNDITAGATGMATLPGESSRMGPPKLPPVPRGGPAGGPQRKRGDPLLNATVRVLSGQYKGYVGTVTVSNRDGTAKVRLQANTRVIAIPKKDLAMKDAAGHFVPVEGGFGIASNPSSSSMSGGYGMTPRAWNDGSATPGRPGGDRDKFDRPSRTPNPFAAAQTPNPYASGAMTPYHAGSGGSDFDGGKTPAWDAGSKTPYRAADDSSWGSSSSRHDPWSASSTAPSSNRDTYGGAGGYTPKDAWEGRQDPSRSSASAWNPSSSGPDAWSSSSTSGPAPGTGYTPGQAYTNSSSSTAYPTDPRRSGAAAYTGSTAGFTGPSGGATPSTWGTTPAYSSSTSSMARSAFGGAAPGGYGSTPQLAQGSTPMYNRFSAPTPRHESSTAGGMGAGGFTPMHMGGSTSVYSQSTSVAPARPAPAAPAASAPIVPTQDSLQGAKWPRTNVLVRIVRATDALAAGTTAKVLKADWDTDTVDLDVPSGGDQVPVAIIEVVPPAKGDRAVALQGEHAGKVGMVIGVHDSAAVVRTGVTFETFPIGLLGKLQE